VAVMVESPWAKPEASPCDPAVFEMVASRPWAEDHVTLSVRFFVVPSE
jgi:hypothetical protein